MEPINHKYEVNATVVSPLSVGQAGEKDWVEGIDYIWSDNTLHHLNLDMMAEAGIPMHELSALYAAGKTDEIRAFLIKKLDDIYDFSLAMPVQSANPVKSFYFNPITGKYVLFGSSLKGAVRSAIFHYLTQTVPASELRQMGHSLDKHVFGDMTKGTDFMRFIRIGDFDFDETGLVNTKIYNLRQDDTGQGWQGGWKHQARLTDGRFNPTGFNTVYECLMPDAQSKGSIMISQILYEKVSPNQMSFKREKDAIMTDSPIQQLFKIINDATLDYLTKEILFFETYSQADYSDRIIDSLRRYHEMASSFTESNGKECLIKMSAGSGFHSITGNWQFNDYTDTGYDTRFGKKRYKSRKIACYNGHFTPMGFLKLGIEP